MRNPILLVGGGAAAVFGLAIAWYLISPLFLRTTLIESPPAATGQAAIARGTFNEIDAVHKGSGTATLSRLPDGRLHIQLDAFSVTNGPDLHVFLSRHAAPANDEQAKDGLLLGALKASDGAFSYETEAAADPAVFRSVVIHCVRFRTIFSFATLA